MKPAAPVHEAADLLAPQRPVVAPHAPQHPPVRGRDDPIGHPWNGQANLAASELIFQGGRFAAEAAEHERSLRTPLALAGAYGASGHAAAHHYVERHAEPMALLVAGRWPDARGRLPVWRSVESPAFAGAFGPLAGRVRHLPLTGAPLGEAVEAARRSSEPVPGTIVLGGRAFGAEVLNNRHCHLVLVRGGHEGATSRLAA